MVSEVPTTEPRCEDERWLGVMAEGQKMVDEELVFTSWHMDPGNPELTILQIFFIRIYFIF